ncbi:MAG: thymidine phosphorylase, partial [Betaproteobacteria bacterium]|nr:thymidine phosphorylase [Betaproteobacteria bacterium]
ELGGGRRQAADTIDPRVGLSQCVQLGQQVQVGDLLAVVHAADAASAERARQTLLGLIDIGDAAPELPATLVRRVVA